VNVHVGRIDKRWRRKEEGFTLLELAVVLSIIAILAVLLTPTIADILDQAALTAALNDARAVKDAMDMYFNDQKPKQYPDSLADYNALRSALAPYLALPSDSTKASFSFVAYCRGTPTFTATTVTCAGTDKNKFGLLIKARNSAETPIQISQTGVAY